MLHIFISIDARHDPEGLAPKKLWIVDIYRSKNPRFKPFLSTAPIETLEIDAPYLLAVQPQGQVYGLLEIGAIGKIPPIRIGEPLKTPIHFYGVHNTPHIITGNEKQQE